MSEVVKHWPGVSVNSTFVYAKFTELGLRFIGNKRGTTEVVDGPGLGIQKSIDDSLLYLPSTPDVHEPTVTVSVYVGNSTDAKPVVSSSPTEFIDRNKATRYPYAYTKDTKGRVVTAFFCVKETVRKDPFGKLYAEGGTFLVVDGEEYKVPDFPRILDMALLFDSTGFYIDIVIFKVGAANHIGTLEYYRCKDAKSTKNELDFILQGSASLRNIALEAISKLVPPAQQGLATAGEALVSLEFVSEGGGGGINPATKEHATAAIMWQNANSINRGGTKYTRGNPNGVVITMSPGAGLTWGAEIAWGEYVAITGVPGEWSSYISKGYSESVVRSCLLEGGTVATVVFGGSYEELIEYPVLWKDTYLSKLSIPWLPEVLEFSCIFSHGREGVGDWFWYEYGGELRSAHKYRDYTDDHVHQAYASYIDIRAQVCLLFMADVTNTNSFNYTVVDIGSFSGAPIAVVDGSWSGEKTVRLYVRVYHGDYAYEYDLPSDGPLDAIYDGMTPFDKYFTGGYGPFSCPAIFPRDGLSSMWDLPLSRGDEYVKFSAPVCLCWEDGKSFLSFKVEGKNGYDFSIQHTSVWPIALQNEIDTALGMPTGDIVDVRYGVVLGE